MEFALNLKILQTLDVILSQDPNQVTCLLEYVRYDLQRQIQLSSIKIMSILRHVRSISFSVYLSGFFKEFYFLFFGRRGGGVNNTVRVLFSLILWKYVL